MEINNSFTNQNKDIEEHKAKNCYKSFKQLVEKFEDVKRIVNLVCVTNYQKLVFNELQTSGDISETNVFFDLLNNCIKKQNIILEKPYISFRDAKDFFTYYENFVDILKNLK